MIKMVSMIFILRGVFSLTLYMFVHHGISFCQAQVKVVNNELSKKHVAVFDSALFFILDDLYLYPMLDFDTTLSSYRGEVFTLRLSWNLYKPHIKDFEEFPHYNSYKSNKSHYLSTAQSYLINGRRAVYFKEHLIFDGSFSNFNDKYVDIEIHKLVVELSGSHLIFDLGHIRKEDPLKSKKEKVVLALINSIILQNKSFK